MDEYLQEIKQLLTQHAQRVETLEQGLQSFQKGVQDQCNQVSQQIQTVQKTAVSDNAEGGGSTAKKVAFTDSTTVAVDTDGHIDPPGPRGSRGRAAVPAVDTSSQGFSDMEPAAIQASFRAIRDSWNKVRLPYDLLFPAQ